MAWKDGELALFYPRWSLKTEDTQDGHEVDMISWYNNTMLS